MAVKKPTKITKATKAKPVKAAKKAVVKKVVKKAVVTKKPEKKTVSLAAVKVEATITGLNATVVDVDGKAKGKMTLPAEVFGEKMNKQLIAQAVRVYLANQRAGGAATKSRGMVEGSTRKIYRQKGTGRARHGNIRAPIFVGGGITFGPVPHDFSMKMPEKMRRMALACALTSQYESGNVVFVDGLASLKPKTKYMARTLSLLTGSVPTLLVVGPETGHVTRTARNIANVTIVSAQSINTYDVVSHNKVVFMKDGVQVVKDIITKIA